MQNSMSEFVALIKEFCTDVLQLNAVICIAVMIILFILEVRWTRSHPALQYMLQRPFPSTAQQAQRTGSCTGPCCDGQKGFVLGRWRHTR